MTNYHHAIIRTWIEAIGSGAATGGKTVRRLKAALRYCCGPHHKSVTVSGWNWRASLCLDTDHLTVEPLRNAITGVLEAA